MIDGMSNVTVDDELSFQTNFLNDEGIVNHSGTDLQVQAQAAPDLTVKVKAGSCYVKRDAWTATSGTLKFWETVLDADANVTIPANSSGGTIRRIICMKIDTGVSPDANASNVASLVVVSGTSGGGDPTIPDNHLPLARVIHNNADTSIASGDIADLRTLVKISDDKVNIPVKASGAEVTTGTDDAKFATAKALADAGVNTRLKSKLISATRDMTASSGDVAYTGVGFMPTAIMAIASTGASGGAPATPMSIGFTDSSKIAGNVSSVGVDTFAVEGNYLILLYQGANFQYANVNSFDADGFTLTWTKGSSPTGIAYIRFLCFR